MRGLFFFTLSVTADSATSLSDITQSKTHLCTLEPGWEIVGVQHRLLHAQPVLHMSMRLRS